MSEGIEVRHQQDCATHNGRRCGCRPGFRASVWSNSDARRIKKTFPDLRAAKDWRREMQTALRSGELRAPTRETLAEAAEAWIEGAKTGAILTSSGDPFKPASVRSYQRALRLRVLPALGRRKLSELRHGEVQDWVDGLVGEGLAPPTIATTVAALRVICRHHRKRGRLAVNPCDNLQVPMPRGARDHIASPDEGAKLLAALPDEDRALWAVALYAGLRRGELRALRVNRIDLEANVIHVERGWDDVEGDQDTKGRNRRRVPITSVLREHLLSHMVRSGRRGEDLVFGATATKPFPLTTLRQRTNRAWDDAGLVRLTLHDCRHTYASLMIAAGCNAKALSVFMGHANISITFDRYGHLMPGSEAEAADLLDAYLNQSARRV